MVLMPVWFVCGTVCAVGDFNVVRYDTCSTNADSVIGRTCLSNSLLYRRFILVLLVTRNWLILLASY